MIGLVPARTLVTISISHYCEKARWALDRAGLAYEERRHLPALHRVAVKRAGGNLTAPVLVCEDGVLPGLGRHHRLGRRAPGARAAAHPR